MRILKAGAVLIVIGCGGPGTLPSDALPSGVSDKSIAASEPEPDENALEQEPLVEVEPLPDGPVLPRLKRSSKEDSKIEDQIYALSDQKKHAEALPLIEKLLAKRGDDPYLIDERIWTCMEVEACHARLPGILKELQDYTDRYPKDANRRITEMDLLEYLKRKDDLYRVAKRFTIHHPTIAEGWIFLGEKELESYRPNRATLSLEKAKQTKVRRKGNAPRIAALEQAIAEYEPLEPLDNGHDGEFLSEAQEKEMDRRRWVIQVRRDFVQSGAEIDVGGGDDY